MQMMQPMPNRELAKWERTEGCGPCVPKEVLVLRESDVLIKKLAGACRCCGGCCEYRVVTQIPLTKITHVGVHRYLGQCSFRITLYIVGGKKASIRLSDVKAKPEEVTEVIGNAIKFAGK